jgi:death-on-curing protein
MRACSLAAAYQYHIVKNHPFVDGNKRTGLDAATAFLDLNGYALPGDEATNERLVDATLAAAEGRMSKSDPAAMFEQLATPTP